MKVDDIRKKSEKDIKKLSDKLRDELAVLSRESVMNNSDKKRRLKKDLAQVLTIHKEILQDSGKETK